MNTYLTNIFLDILRSLKLTENNTTNNNSFSTSVSDLVNKLTSSSLADVLPDTDSSTVPSFLPSNDNNNEEQHAQNNDTNDTDNTNDTNNSGGDDAQPNVSLSDVSNRINDKAYQEIPVPDDETSAKRMFALNSIALHYYFASNRNWLDAYTTALDELAAVCLLAEGSPIEYNDPVSADLVAVELGYPNYQSLAQDIATKGTNCNVLIKFANATVDFAKKYWFFDKDFSEVSPSDYARAVTSEIRSNWPAAKASAGSIIPLLADDTTGEVKTEDGSEARFIGVNETDEYWSPVSMSIMPADVWKQRCEDDDTTLPIDDDTTVDDDVLSMVYLQSYQWENRSWNKALNNAKGFCDIACTFCWSAIANEFVAENDEVKQARFNRLNELANELMDESGTIVLQKQADHFGRETFTPKSQEFVDLFNAQKRAESHEKIREADATLLPLMSKIDGSVAQMLVDDILASVYERAGGRDEKAQIAALNAIHDDIMQKIEENSKQYKTKWKKYLSNNKEAADAIKYNITIIDEDDEGNPLFEPKGINLMYAAIDEAKRQEQEKQQNKKNNKKKKRH